MFAAENQERIKKNFKSQPPQICSRRREKLTTSMSLYPNQDWSPMDERKLSHLEKARELALELSL